MATEIERKFLVINDSWKKSSTSRQVMKQGYFGDLEKASIRVRVHGNNANINIKSAALDISRLEFEFPLSLAEAEEILDKLCIRPLIEKIRYYVPFEGHTWEVDEFMGDNQGLVVAEIELQHEDEKFQKPDWLGEEVSLDKRYYNVCLVKHPYKNW